MRHGITRIIATLGMVMVAAFAFWEMLERVAFDREVPAGFYLTRGVITAVLMSILAAWLMARYRRGYEELLRQQSIETDRTRQFFESIVQHAGEGIISLNPQGRVRTWNGAAEAIYGYTEEEMVGRSLDCLLPPDLREEGELEALDATVARHGFVRDVETRRMRKDGEVRTVRLARSALRDENGGLMGSAAVIRDVTAERELESRLIQAERLAAIGQAGAGIAHEVRNALAGISGAVHILRRSKAWTQLPDGFGDEVDLQVRRMGRIVEDLLTYARPGPLRTQPTDLHRVLRETAGGAEALEGKAKQLRLDFADGEFAADVDPVWMEQGFRNLILNSFQAMPPGGVLSITTACRNGMLEIRFSDNGPGMDEQARERAFEPFFTTKARGTGLGLPIVRTIVEAHSGSIELAPGPEGGAMVILRLPPAAEEGGETDESESNAGSKLGAMTESIGESISPRRPGSSDRP